MKKIFIIFCLIFVVVSLFYFLNKNTDGYWVCKNGKWVKQGKPSYPKPVVSCNKKPALPKNKEECLSEGGIWKKQGTAPFETCNKKTIDRGNLCRDNSKYEGLCQIQLTKEELRQAMGGKKLLIKNMANVLSG